MTMVTLDENRPTLGQNKANDEKPSSRMTTNNSERTSADGNGDAQERPYEFSNLSNSSATQPPGNIDFILDIPLEIAVEVGRARMLISELLKLGQGSVVELSKMAGETLDIMANQTLIARGEVVVTNDKYGIRLTEIVSPMERIESLR
ncbi:MAG: flagellar motor switch protein FliN [Thermodesulfobacteriota bacterium]|nr:flagellar motor switch protein FliN [Thermodesulfobacteriota bacterium]